MVIEWLRFKVPHEKWEAFIQRDEEVWTAGLRSFPGFLGKETWVDPVEKRLACGDVGVGGMAEPTEIVATIETTSDALPGR